MPKDASKSLASVAADQLMARRIPVGSAVVQWVELLPAEVSEVLSALQTEMLPAQGVRKVQGAPPAENIERSGPSGQVLPVAALAEPALPVLRACIARPEGPALPLCVLLRPVTFRVSALAITTISELCWMSVSSGYLNRSVQARRVNYIPQRLYRSQILLLQETELYYPWSLHNPPQILKLGAPAVPNDQPVPRQHNPIMRTYKVYTSNKK